MADDLCRFPSNSLLEWIVAWVEYFTENPQDPRIEGSTASVIMRVVKRTVRLLSNIIAAKLGKKGFIWYFDEDDHRRKDYQLQFGMALLIGDYGQANRIHE
jgi:hypothetical protein